MNSEHLTWEELLLQFYGWMCVYAKSLTRDVDRAQDLVQDTIVRILKRGLDPNILASPRAYVTRVMQNAFRDNYRKAKRTPEISNDPESTGSPKEPVSESHIQSDLEKQELFDLVRQEMARLPEDDKNLLALLLDGETYEDISKSTGQDIRIVRADGGALKAKLRYRFRDKG